MRHEAVFIKSFWLRLCRARSLSSRTQNGEAKAVAQNIADCEQTHETMALLKILALGNAQIKAGRVRPATAAITRLRERRGTC